MRDLAKLGINWRFVYQPIVGGQRIMYHTCRNTSLVPETFTLAKYTQIEVSLWSWHYSTFLVIVNGDIHSWPWVVSRRTILVLRAFGMNFPNKKPGLVMPVVPWRRPKRLTVSPGPYCGPAVGKEHWLSTLLDFKFQQLCLLEQEITVKSTHTSTGSAGEQRFLEGQSKWTPFCYPH